MTLRGQFSMAADTSARSLVSVALRKTIVGYPSLPTMWCLAVEGCRLRCSLDYDEPGGPSIMYAQLIDAPGRQSRPRSCK
jgi:hypothetical protein